MSITIEPLNTVLQWRLDAIAFVVLGAGAGYGTWAFLRRRQAQREVAPAAGATLAAFMVLSVLGVEWISKTHQQSLGAEFTALAPTYAHGLRSAGHARITAGTPPEDPTYLAAQHTVLEWSRLNPSLGELFTFRLDADRNVRLVLDGGEHAPGTPSSPGEGFLRSLAGETHFDPTIQSNARGAWVRAFAPIRDANGSVEAGLVLGYPAADWLRSVAAVRGWVLGGATGLLAGLLGLVAFLAVMCARIREGETTERELHEAKIAADEASRAKSAFLAVMSHEIRTPLNAVMGFANLLAESNLDDAQRACVATITSEGARLGSLVNDLLDLSKIEEGRLVLERLPFAPAETALDVLRLLNGRAQEKRIELRFEAQLAGPLLVAGDPLRFRQILVNLIDNAIKFTPQGSVTLFLRWTPGASNGEPGHLAVRIRDTGIGIPSEKLEDIFQKFMQADTSMTRRYGGTGLAICQHLVGLMGGRITVESRLGHGSEFAFTIPLTPVATTPEPPPIEPEPVLAHPRAPRILVVDDMETNRFLLEIFLRRNGFEPELASGGEEAVLLAGRNDYDAILMDLQMPDIDGFEAVRRIRAQERPGRHTPILALTALIAPGTREKCLAAGMDEHLTKPLDLKRFKILLNTFISRDGPAVAGTPAPPVPPAP
jgi:signal transduction histidine kinase/ActR/RegA family two-component response regulator